MTSAHPNNLAVVIPAFNEATTIANIAQRALLFSSKVIVVNDGSTDETADSLATLPVTVLSNPENLGKGKSLVKGAKYAMDQGISSLITLDGDGQHQPEDIPLLLEQATLNPNMIIIASRLRSRHAAPPLRRFANAFADFWISWAAGQRIHDSQSGFRLYPTDVFNRCNTSSDKFVFESEILIDAAHEGILCKSVPIETVYHKNSRASHYRPLSDTWGIVIMVAKKLIIRGFYPIGLARSLGLLANTSTVRH